MKTLTRTHFGRTDVFRILDEFPAGYKVWNIGRQNFPFEGYIPIAKPSKENKYYIDRATLAAVKVEDEIIALRVLCFAGQHPCGKEDFERLITQ